MPSIADCDVCGCEQVEVHHLAACERCRAAAGRFAYWTRSKSQADAAGASAAPAAPVGGVGAETAAGSLAETFACSFCGRLPSEVTKMFSGPWAFICDGCVALAVEALRADAPPPTARRQPTQAQTSGGRDATHIGRAPGPGDDGGSGGPETD